MPEPFIYTDPSGADLIVKKYEEGHAVFTVTGQNASLNEVVMGDLILWLAEKKAYINLDQKKRLYDLMSK